jgi:hypothetical protein
MPDLINVFYVSGTLMFIFFRFTWYFTQCDDSLTAGYAARLMYKDNVGAIFGPVCPESKLQLVDFNPTDRYAGF